MQNDAYYALFTLRIAEFPTDFSGAVAAAARDFFANGAPVGAHLPLGNDDCPTGVAALEHRESVVAIGHVVAPLQRSYVQFPPLWLRA